MQILKEEVEDAKPLASCEETRKEWAKHGQCDSKVQHLKRQAVEKRRVEEFRGGYAKVIGEVVRECSKELQWKDRSGVRWGSPQSSVGFDERSKRKRSGILGEGGTEWEMAAEWDATDGRIGGAGSTVWETLLEMERFDYIARADLVGIALGLDLAKAFARVSLPVVLAWQHISIFPGRSCVRFAATSNTEGAVRRMCGRAAPDHYGHSIWVKVELLAPAHCVAGRPE